jgi:hypothetical protein
MKAIRAKQALFTKRVSALCTFLVLAITVLSLAGCAPKLIGDYDSAFDSGITDIQQKAELYFAKLQSTPNTPYDQSFYDDIDSRLAVLKTRATVEPKEEILVGEFTNLKAQFDDFEKLDKATTRPFPSAAVAAAQSGIETSVESILKLELALKGGAKSPPELSK